MLAAGRPDQISAFLLTEPDAGSDPARLVTIATPTDDGTPLRAEWTQAVDHQRSHRRIVVVMAGPRSTTDVAEASPRSVLHRRRATGITLEHRNEFMGLRGIENGVTRLDKVRSRLRPAR